MWMDQEDPPAQGLGQPWQVSLARGPQSRLSEKREVLREGFRVPCSPKTQAGVKQNGRSRSIQERIPPHTEDAGDA